MKIAILGASGHIAKSMIDYLWKYDRKSALDLRLFGRTPENVNHWLAVHGILLPIECKSFSQFENGVYDLVINMVGTSNSSEIKRLGSKIFDTALAYDDVVLRYLRMHPTCRYFFLSSGAVYGNDFAQAAQEATMARHQINSSTNFDWYGVSKFCIEARHRALVDYAIVDIRVFSYFSAWIDLVQPFLLTDAMSAIQQNSVLQTDDSDFWRDYVGVVDLAQLLNCFMDSAPCNACVDLYSKNPMQKSEVLELFKTDFGLRYTLNISGAVTTSLRAMYFSRNHSAARWGYSPSQDSRELVSTEARKILEAF